MKPGLDYDEDFIDPAIVAMAVICILRKAGCNVNEERIYDWCHKLPQCCNNALSNPAVLREYLRIDQEVAAFDISNFLPRRAQ